MRLVVTGSAGRLARVLIPQLLADPGIEIILGIDHRDARYADPRYRHHRLDVRDPAAAEVCAGADALLHLAFVLMGGGLGHRRHDRATLRAINVDGSRQMFEAAAQHRLRHILFVSSAAVYGAWPDNPPLLPETAPLRPMPGFAYAEDKVAVERLLDAFERGHPAIAVTRLRPHAIIGPHAHPFLNHVLRQPFYPASRALTQCVWEDDVAAAAVLALRQRATGAFNLAAQPALSLYDMLGRTRRLRLPLPLAPAGAVHRLLWWLTPAVGEPGWVQGTRYSLALDTRRAEIELVWHPRVPLAACLQWRGARQ
ncbi:NAD-dependent epimerase/dehydratase family protein [Acidihalobacter ferrooxydans]|uniref:NAD-dependent dehydratase n=1 Tax=Acidihalobacter ferrooxydans TaxID=1765967 RepID=A0A1P8UF25_9GAMM|nr:NAD-dependent epimerase/dehydratase family protein [Acidihalobacter ferrooxydans]APZ42453.1 NAD-dependent dehydratase [Acidihalobacter ferrooxydans]